MKKKILIGVVAVIIAFGVIGALSGENKKEGVQTSQEITTEIKEEKTKISAEALAALGKAELYSTMDMSKKGIYNQLISEVEGFSEKDAQYAVDNIIVDWNKNALEKAKIYQSMHMSRKAIYQQLISDVEGFTKEEADYALKNLPE